MQPFMFNAEQINLACQADAGLHLAINSRFEDLIDSDVDFQVGVAPHGSGVLMTVGVEITPVDKFLVRRCFATGESQDEVAEGCAEMVVRLHRSLTSYLDDLFGRDRDPIALSCLYCGGADQDCPICSDERAIRADAAACNCKFCQARYHSDHWPRLKGKCPVCQKSMLCSCGSGYCHDCCDCKKCTYHPPDPRDEAYHGSDQERRDKLAFLDPIRDDPDWDFDSEDDHEYEWQVGDEDVIDWDHAPDWRSDDDDDEEWHEDDAAHYYNDDDVNFS